MDEYHIIFVQELYYSHIKQVMSNADHVGEMTIRTQMHLSWKRLETKALAKVYAYVKTELADLHPRLCSHIVDDPDMMLISHHGG